MKCYAALLSVIIGFSGCSYFSSDTSQSSEIAGDVEREIVETREKEPSHQEDKEIKTVSPPQDEEDSVAPDMSAGRQESALVDEGAEEVLRMMSGDAIAGSLEWKTVQLPQAEISFPVVLGEVVALVSERSMISQPIQFVSLEHDHDGMNVSAFYDERTHVLMYGVSDARTFLSLLVADSQTKKIREVFRLDGEEYSAQLQWRVVPIGVSPSREYVAYWVENWWISGPSETGQEKEYFVMVQNIATGEVLFEKDFFPYFTRLAWGNDRDVVAYVKDETIFFWDIKSANEPKPLYSSGGIREISFADDETIIFSDVLRTQQYRSQNPAIIANDPMSLPLWALDVETGTVTHHENVYGGL